MLKRWILRSAGVLVAFLLAAPGSAYASTISEVPMAVTTTVHQNESSVQTSNALTGAPVGDPKGSRSGGYHTGSRSSSSRVGSTYSSGSYSSYGRTGTGFGSGFGSHLFSFGSGFLFGSMFHPFGGYYGYGAGYGYHGFSFFSLLIDILILYVIYRIVRRLFRR